MSLLLGLSLLLALGGSSALAQSIEMYRPDPTFGITISGPTGYRWTEGAYEVWYFSQGCVVEQGRQKAVANEGVFWIDREASESNVKQKVIAYFQGQVELTVKSPGNAPGNQSRLNDHQWFGRYRTQQEIRVQAAKVLGEPKPKPPAYSVALARRTQPVGTMPGDVQQAQFDAVEEPANEAGVLPPGARRLRAFPRNTVRPEVQWVPNPQNPNESVVVINRGINLLVDGLPALGSIDIAADRVVIWTEAANQLELFGESLQPNEMPLELYMEGNIVFRQGTRTIYADRMYYDVRREAGVVVNSELYTSAPGYSGLVRLKADVIRQVDRNRFFAQNAFVTTSGLATPSYRLQTRNIEFEDYETPLVDGLTGEVAVDPLTGEPETEKQLWATSRGNTIYAGQVPVFYWPTFSSNLRDPGFFIRRARFKNDSIFGTQALIDLAPYELLGIRNPWPGTDWDISTDYLSERGFGLGTSFRYEGTELWGMGGQYAGLIDAWGIQDGGRDNLGQDRPSLLPEEELRYRLLARHRQDLGNDWSLTAELGKISDRNFVEQYYESEWDQFKDFTTGLELKHLQANRSFSVNADIRLNPFFTQTEWLPKADHYWLGQQLLDERLTWYEHTSVGFARFRNASTPTDPVDASKFGLLPWEPGDFEGERLTTRQEIDLPLEAGPFKIVPYALGEVSHWGEDLSGDSLDRLYGQAGVRASVPFFSVNPNVESELFNVHGISHKITLDTEFSYADANRDVQELPLYEQLDDDSIEHFRRRFAFNTFGGVTPTQFDERLYAIRSGLGSWVTSPSMEVADDLTVFRAGIHQRWQTKRGPPENRRIIDWMTLDTDLALFPQADRDNFGETLGLVSYDYRWYVGDRLTLLADGGFDFFDMGQHITTFGAILSRPPRGNLYVGYRSLEGPFSSQIVQTTLNYQLSPKWYASFGTAIDVSGTGNIGQQLALTRVGESVLFSVGFNVDASKDNVGVNFAIQPRFLPRARFGRSGTAFPIGVPDGVE